MKIWKEFRFEASHQIWNHPGKCARLHGHSWVLRVECEGRLNEATGMVVDFYDIKQAVQPLVDQLDHTHFGSGYVIFNGLPSQWLGKQTDLALPMLPTSENLLWFIGDWLEEHDPLFLWSKLSLMETCTSSAELERGEYVRWRAQRKEEPSYALYQEAKGTQGEEAPARSKSTQDEEDVAEPAQPPDTTYSEEEAQRLSNEANARAKGMTVAELQVWTEEQLTIEDDDIPF